MLVRTLIDRSCPRLGFPIFTAYRRELDRIWKIPLYEENIQGIRAYTNTYKPIRRHIHRTSLVDTIRKLFTLNLCNIQLTIHLIFWGGGAPTP